MIGAGAGYPELVDAEGLRRTVDLPLLEPELAGRRVHRLDVAARVAQVTHEPPGGVVHDLRPLLEPDAPEEPRPVPPRFFCTSVTWGYAAYRSRANCCFVPGWVLLDSKNFTYVIKILSLSHSSS